MRKSIQKVVASILAITCFSFVLPSFAFANEPKQANKISRGEIKQLEKYVELKENGVHKRGQKAPQKGPVGWTLKAIKGIGKICRAGDGVLKPFLRKAGVSPANIRMFSHNARKIAWATEKLDRAAKKTPD